LTEPAPILKIEDLTVAYRQQGVWLEAVRDFSLAIAPGQTYGLVGESGSGKTTVSMSVMRYLGRNGVVKTGHIEFDGNELLDLDAKRMPEVWGSQIALVPQNPLSSLNPSIRVGEQVAEGLRHHLGLSKSAAAARALQLLRLVRLPEPERVVASFPHQISGGMQQRILIAIALSASPRLLILDEPTTSLDVTTQASILDLFADLIHDRQTAVLYVTHNLGVVAQICDRVAVLYAGELVEDGPVNELFARPLHPYTRGLLESIPRMENNRLGDPLKSIPGQIPALAHRPTGCVFAPRCSLAIAACAVRPPLQQVENGRSTRCYRWEDLTGGSKRVSQAPAAARSAESSISSSQRSISTLETPATLRLSDLKVHFTFRRSLADIFARRPARRVRALDGVSLEIGKGRTLGLVGESGCGKTTLVRAVVGLLPGTEGQMELLGFQLPAGLAKRSLETLRRLQMVFQNPEDALNPYHTIEASLTRPLVNLLGLSRGAARIRARELLASVRLPASYLTRYPRQLSGGEKQRVAIARAFAANPDLLIADEPVSSLDVSVQASILNLLAGLQSEHKNAMLFISHDLAVVSYLADEIAVLYLGNLIEYTQTVDLLAPPYHPYTEALLSAIPQPDPTLRRERIRLDGDLDAPLQSQAGCPFYARCPRVLGEICATQTPPWRVSQQGKRIACHIPLEELSAAQKKQGSIADP
jgi:peptide/nickel transport system ATP-binding protein